MNFKHELEKVLKNLRKKVADGSATKQERADYQKAYIRRALRDWRPTESLTGLLKTLSR